MLFTNVDLSTFATSFSNLFNKCSYIKKEFLYFICMNKYFQTVVYCRFVVWKAREQDLLLVSKSVRFDSLDVVHIYYYNDWFKSNAAFNSDSSYIIGADSPNHATPDCRGRNSTKPFLPVNWIQFHQLYLALSNTYILKITFHHLCTHL